MKIFLNNIIIKKILIILITIIMVSNFIMPNYVHAANNKDGNKLVNGFFYLLAWGGDAILKTMQKIMMGTADIIENNEYAIKYSPGIIFSNTVPALDIDFIGADASYNDTVDRKYTDVENEKEIVELIEKSNINKNNFTLIENLFELEEKKMQEEALNYGLVITYHEAKTEGDISDYQYSVIHDGAYGLWTYFGKWFDLQENRVGKVLSDDIGMFDSIMIYIYGNNLYKVEFIDNTFSDKTANLYSCPISLLNQNTDTIKLDSVAYKLKGSISTWYLALRAISLVGLLSVLVYIGIRIILSSASAQDKAKYKNMLKDWLVAICILFVLHYFMAFMLQLTNSLNGIIKNNALSLTDVGNTTDDLMNSIRQVVGDIDKNTTWDMAGYTVMYLALVILTGIFTVQYLKRVIFVAFLTMIAPMIALTYPLDKIKDGKAQAFGYWIREYIFNCLIQPVHLLIYTILITNAIDFATENILYAIVALAFMVPAEKFIKEMFGMKSSSPTGTLGAAAGGALVMSMLQKIKGKPPKEQANEAGAGASSSPNGVRTATRNGTPVQNPQNPNPQNPNPQNQNPQNPNPQNPNPQNPNPQNPNPQNPNQVGTTTSRNALGGLNALGKRYIYGANALKSNVGRLTGMAGAVAAGTVGLAAQVADGDLFNDPKKALTDAAVAMGAGYAGGKNLSQNVIQGVNNVPKHIDNIRDTFDQGSLSAEEYQNRKFDRQFFNSNDYKAITQDSRINQTNIRERTQQFLDNGITDAKVIREALQLGISGDEYKAYANVGATSAMDIQELKQNGVDTNKLKDIQLYSGDTSMDKIKRYSTIAQAARSAGIVGDGSANDLNNFKLNFAAGHHLDDAEAEKLYKKLLHYWN